MKQSAARLALAASNHIFEHREVGKEPNALKGAGNACFGQVMRFECRLAKARKRDCSGRWFNKTTCRVERRRLPGTVWANEANNFTTVDGKIDVRERMEATKDDGHVVEVHQWSVCAKHGHCSIGGLGLSLDDPCGDAI